MTQLITDNGQLPKTAPASAQQSAAIAPTRLIYAKLLRVNGLGRCPHCNNRTEHFQFVSADTDMGIMSVANCICGKLVRPHY